MYKLIKDLVKKRLEERKNYDTSELWISRMGVLSSESQKIEYTKRYVFRGPYTTDERTYYEIFPTMDPVYVYPEGASIFFADTIRFDSLFPDLKRVNKNQINKITKDLQEKDKLCGQYIPDDEEQNNTNSASLTLGQFHDLH